jgi:formylglycine-generating enzyme required for sulfatase activity
MKTISPRGLLGCLILVLAGCGSGGGGGSAPAVNSQILSGSFRILDLATGELGEPQSTVNISDTSLLSTRMVFVEVVGGSFAPGESGGALGKQADETRGGSQTVATRWVAALETTRAQWRTLSEHASEPWSSLDPLGTTGGADARTELPASGLTLTAVQQAMTDFNARSVSGDLALPSAVEWEWFCRGTDVSRFAWGDDQDAATVAEYAILGRGAPAVVGERTPNANLLFDMHGNVREWTSDNELRGGGWSDHVLRARAANHIDSVDVDTVHPLSGVRFRLDL